MIYSRTKDKEQPRLGGGKENLAWEETTIKNLPIKIVKENIVITEEFFMMGTLMQT